MSMQTWTPADKIDEILDLNARGLPAKEISRRAKVSKSTVYREVAEFAAKAWLCSKRGDAPQEAILEAQRILCRVADQIEGLAISGVNAPSVSDKRVRRRRDAGKSAVA